MHHCDLIGGLMVEYDVLGNERHKAICKLREMPKLYPNKDGGADLYAWKSALADAIGADTELFSAIRDRLIHLLGGDQPTLSELFGILREDDDGVDARPSDSASADSPVHGSAGCGCGGTCGCDGEELLAPITTELRSNMRIYGKFSIDDGKQHVELEAETFAHLCDAIDAIHAGLERENEELRKRTMYPSETERVNMLEREVKRLTSECKTQRNNFDQATSAREHWKTLYEQALEQIHDLERDYATACSVNERQDKEYIALAERCCKIITPPLGADGLPINIGDVMEWPDGDDEPFEVVGIGENGTLFYMYDDSCEWTNAKNKVHHVPTVEDVLRDFALAMNENLVMYTGEAIDADEWRKADERTIADYAAKLKLADA